MASVMKYRQLSRMMRELARKLLEWYANLCEFKPPVSLKSLQNKTLKNLATDRTEKIQKK
jgi:hypothetical protein